MNMKLLAGLAVVITLASAMTFVGLATKPVEPVAISDIAPASVPAAPKAAINPNVTSGAATVDTKVKIIDNTVKTKVMVE